MPVVPNAAPKDDRHAIRANQEAALLLVAARVALGDADRETLRELASDGPDWSKLLELAKAHALRPLLFRNLEQARVPNLPRDILAKLWIHREQLQAKNRLMLDELKAILALFASAGIPALPLKGPMLALKAYGDLALREFSDLDLLVPHAHRQAARRLLAERGYVSFFPISEDAEAALLRSPVHYHVALKRELMVELHWKTDAEFPIEPPSADAWWQGLATADCEGVGARALAPHEQVLALCLHGSKHHWSSLHWLVDIAALLEAHPELDWSWILGKAEDLRASRRLALGLLLLRDPMQCELPAQVDTWLSRHTPIETLAREIAGDWFVLPPARLSAWRRLRRNLSLYETTTARLSHVANVILRPSLAEWSRWPLPRPLFFLYLPLRGWRLLAKQFLA